MYLPVILVEKCDNFPTKFKAWDETHYWYSFVWFQNIDVTKQAEVDKIMLELDGTDNKC